MSWEAKKTSLGRREEACLHFFTRAIKLFHHASVYDLFSWKETSFMNLLGILLGYSKNNSDQLAIVNTCYRCQTFPNVSCFLWRRLENLSLALCSFIYFIQVKRCSRVIALCCELFIAFSRVQYVIFFLLITFKLRFGHKRVHYPPWKGDIVFGLSVCPSVRDVLFLILCA